MDDKLYLWTQDCSYRGSIVVVAKNETSAREKMSDCHNYDHKNPVIRHDIDENFVHCDLAPWD